MRTLNTEEVNQIQGAGVIAATVYGTVGFWTGLIIGGVGTCGLLAHHFAVGGALIGFIAGMDDRPPQQVIVVYEQPIK